MRSRLNIIVTVGLILILSLPFTLDLFANLRTYTPRQGTFEELVLSELYDFPFTWVSVGDYREYSYHFEAYRDLPLRQRPRIRMIDFRRDYVIHHTFLGYEAMQTMELFRNVELVSYVPENRHPCNEYIRLTFSRTGLFSAGDLPLSDDMQNAARERLAIHIFADAGSMYIVRHDGGTAHWHMSGRGPEGEISYFRFSGLDVRELLSIFY